MRGAAGEQATAEVLAGLANRRWVVLHDRAMPGTRANVDHLVIGPTGVWLIDSKTSRAPVRAGWRSVWLGERRLDSGPTRWEAEVASERLGVEVRALIVIHGTGLPHRGGRAGGVRVVSRTACCPGSGGGAAGCLTTRSTTWAGWRRRRCPRRAATGGGDGSPVSEPSPRPAAVPIPAATVVPLRDGDSGLEVLLLQRNARGEFGHMWVFPGGRVDDGDHAGDHADDHADDRDDRTTDRIPSDRNTPATTRSGRTPSTSTLADYVRGEPSHMAAARRAAVREAREESGLELDEQRLVTLSFWLPPPVSPRRFATWFFLAPASQGGAIRVDQVEIHDHRWLTPAAAIGARDAGEITLAPPTFMTLWWLSAHAGVEEALEEAASREPERYETHIAGGGQGPAAALWQGDAGYEDYDVHRSGRRRRVVLDPAGWRVEMDP